MSKSNSQAIVTMAVGQKYYDEWKHYCEKNWRIYAELHGYDIILIDKPLDESDRAKKRHMSWQKCLVLSQDFAKKYERIVWLDADMLINTKAAPSVTAGVPIDKVGVVEIWSEPYPEWYQECLRRMYEFWGPMAIVNYAPREYYSTYGFPRTFDKVPGNAVMVMSPVYHRELLERNYYDYEDRGGVWNAEMRPFSYEVMNLDCAQWLDYRFCYQWFEVRFMYYPFLINPAKSRSFLQRAARKLSRLAGVSLDERLNKLCINAAFQNSFFLHCGGDTKKDMKLVDVSATSWRECTL